MGESLKRFGIAEGGKGAGKATSAVTDILVASIHKGAPDVSHSLSSLTTDPALLHPVPSTIWPSRVFGRLAQDEHVKALVQGNAHPVSSLADVADHAAIKAVSANPNAELWHCLHLWGVASQALPFNAGVLEGERLTYVKPAQMQRWNNVLLQTGVCTARKQGLFGA